MICAKPYSPGYYTKGVVTRGSNQYFGCGQCRYCRINRRRQWTDRQMLESYLYPQGSSFVTLTYNDEHLPKFGNLVPEDLRLFLMRFRKAVYPFRFRYFACGEYSHDRERAWNPHYHLNLFGVSWLGQEAAKIEASWTREGKSLGFVTVKEFNRERAAYTAGYVVKKYTRENDDILEGHNPEFARMSNRPGLGRDAMKILAASFKKAGVKSAPEIFQIATRRHNLGRYLLQKVREDFGLSEDQINALKQSVSNEAQKNLQTLFLAALKDAPNEPVTFKKVYLQSTAQRRLQVDARQVMNFNSSRKL